MKQRYNFNIFRCCVLIIFLLMTILASDQVYAADYYTEGSFQYTINGDYVVIHSYFGSEEAVEIPAMIAELPVHEIDDYAFAGCLSVKSITIPDTVISVGEKAFTGAKNLQKIMNQSEKISPKAGEQVLIIEDYPMYAPDRISGNADTAASTATQPEGSQTSNSEGNYNFQIEAEDADEQEDSLIAVPDSSAALTVDDSDNLILIDENGTITVLDRSTDYAITHKEDGTAVISDVDGNEIAIENGMVKKSNGETITVIKNQKSPKIKMGYIVLVMIGVLIIGGGMILLRKKEAE